MVGGLCCASGSSLALGKHCLLNLMRKCAQMQRQSVEHLAFREVRG